MRAYSQGLRQVASKIKPPPLPSYTCTRCINTLNRPSPRPSLPTCRLRTLNPAKRRTFISLFLKNEAPVEERAYEQNPGIRILATLVRYRREKIGFEPSTKEVLKAINKMSLEKEVFASPGNIIGLIEAFEVLMERGDAGLIPEADARRCLNHHARACRERKGAGYPKADIKFGEQLFHQIINVLNESPRDEDYKHFIQVLARYSQLDDATAICQKGATEHGMEVVTADSWIPIMAAYRAVGDEKGMLRIINEMDRFNIPHKTASYRQLIGFYIAQKDRKNVQKWYNKMREDGVSIDWKIYQEIFLAYDLEGADEQEASRWTRDLIRGVLDVCSGRSVNSEAEAVPWSPEDAKLIWGLALRWCLARGKNVDEIDKLMRAVRDYPDSTFEPGTWTINLLVMYGIEKKDPYLAERLVALGHKWGFTPDRKSFALQVEYRLLANDLEGARAAWEELKYYEKVDDDLGTETKALLKATILHPKADPEKVTYIYQDIIERSIPLDTEILSPLLLFYMRKNDMPNFVSVLTREVLNYNPEDREAIIQLIAEYMGDPKTSHNDAWPIYEILTEVFLELDMATRCEIMKMFFNKGRPDMGVVVFTNMRMSKNARPDHKAYRDAILGVGDYSDIEGLWQIHDMLKIDINIEPNTEIRNALMLAYELCEDPRKSLEVFKSIMESIEGPDKNSLSLAMTACGRIAGEMTRKGDKIWKWFIKKGIMPTEINFSWYVTAWLLNGDFEKAFGVVKNMEKDHGVRPGPRTLLALYAEAPELTRPKIAKWAEEHYPEEWGDLDEIRDTAVEDVEKKRNRIYL